jgi:hypothetical protein
MKAELAHSAKIFFSPNALLPFFVGSLFLAVLGSSVYQMLTNWLGTSTSAALKIALGSLLILMFSVLGLRWVLSRAPARPPLLSERPPAKRRGLILLVSNIAACQKAIRYHQPELERCWLLCSLKSLEKANVLCSEFPNICLGDPIIINDVNNPLEFRECVNAIYTRLPDGWQEEDVIADYTGMTAHASVGMALACLVATRPLQYTPASYDEKMQAIAPLDPIEIVLDWNTGNLDDSRNGAGSLRDEVA